jgi:hypothetical protein
MNTVFFVILFLLFTFRLLQTDRIAAMVELVNFLLMVNCMIFQFIWDVSSLLVCHHMLFITQSAGAQKKWVAEDVDLEALEPDELDVLVRIRGYSCGTFMFSYVTMDI